MTDYYIKKDPNDEAHLHLDCSVNSSNDTLTVQGLYLYSDAPCQQPYSSPPTIAASDAFNTSQGSCTIHLQPTSGVWTFRARKKAGSTLYNPLVVTGDANTPASFSVVATASGYSDLVLDPTIKFRNSIMQQAGVPTATMLASAYLDPPFRGAHGISLVLPVGPSKQPGVLTFDSNPHPLDEWGEPVGPSIYAPRLHEVEAVVQLRTDEARGRTLGRLECKGLDDAEVFLVRDDPADRWTLIYAPSTGGRLVVPMFRQ